MTNEIASMLEEIEGVIRKYRRRLEGGADRSGGAGAADANRLKILRFVKENEPVVSSALYEYAKGLGMSTQGLGGFFRKARNPRPDAKKAFSAMLKKDANGKYGKVWVDEYGELVLSELELAEK